MTLKTLFAIPIAIILIVLLSVAGMITGQSWSGQERGRAAVDAVERMRLLLKLQSDLRAERLVSNLALGKPYPIPDSVKSRLSGARRATDNGIAAIAASILQQESEAEQYPGSANAGLLKAREGIDALLASGQSARTFAELNTVMPALLAVSQLLDAPLERASLAVTAADPGLSGTMMLDRLTSSLRDQIGLLAAVLLPRSNAGEPATEADRNEVRALLARASFLTRFLGNTIEVAGATPQIRESLARLRTTDLNAMTRKLLNEPDGQPAFSPAAASGISGYGGPTPQLLLVPWGEQINSLRAAIVDSMVRRVTATGVARERTLDIVIAAFGAILIAVLEFVVLLSQRVVGPLAHLGDAIRRIAAGDRAIALSLPSGIREITEMVTAVETLRQAALVADTATLRQRMAARQRLVSLRQALGIAQTVREPALALERGVASLSEGIDATIALFTTPTSLPPASLGLAATAVRAGLEEMRGCAAGLEATFAAASSAQTEDRPEAEFVAHILAVQAQVHQRDASVRGFIQSSLVGLRDTALASGPTQDIRHWQVIREMVSDQFQYIETTVATVASMRDAVSRAALIVRELPLEDTAMLV
jgi:HAMP domain-containing protein